MGLITWRRPPRRCHLRVSERLAYVTFYPIIPADLLSFANATIGSHLWLEQPKRTNGRRNNVARFTKYDGVERCRKQNVELYDIGRTSYGLLALLLSYQVGESSLSV
ncbi:hypothetical protein RB3197 [Rhodopirellula baltica SH 1]|uniref:Uncharacterized protein n=1 Tax=Rhodopirellula baltica (strain DSM 10527 / NCIMB 13988 / SH1) TaxID=243090 RepID=Q7UUM8_RHOBA|nr:hypothetical protein RB3197 [Rhodopirellula baltica SH 1]